MNDKDKAFEKNMKLMDKLFASFDEIRKQHEANEFIDFFEAYLFQIAGEKEYKRFIRHAKARLKDVPTIAKT
jgi:hypothetical protein